MVESEGDEWLLKNRDQGLGQVIGQRPQTCAKAGAENKCTKECAVNKCKPLLVMGVGNREGRAYEAIDCVAGSMTGNRMDEGACKVTTSLAVCYCVP